MPRLLRARAPQDAAEEGTVRHLAASRHAPADWRARARMVVRSWAGLGTIRIAAELGCHPQTVRERLTRFNVEGLDGFGDRPGGGRPSRLTEAERSTLIALARSTPPGRLVRRGDGLAAADEAGAARWTLDSLAAAAGARGVRVGRQPGASHPAARGRPLAADAVVGHQRRPRVRPKRTRIIALRTSPPAGATILDLDELGPVTPRTDPPAPGWSPDGHRVKAPLEYGRGPEKVWVYGALRERDGQALTLTARSRNTAGYLRLLAAVDAANPDGDLDLIADNLSSHTSPPIQAWLAEHPRVHPAPIPTGACWLNLQEGWWRLFRRETLAGQSFADAEEIDCATTVATRQLNRRATPWIWGRPPPPRRRLRRRFVYFL